MSLETCEYAEQEDICDICHQKMHPLPSRINPEKSEYYCSTCHKSYKMSPEFTQYFLAQRKNR